MIHVNIFEACEDGRRILRGEFSLAVAPRVGELIQLPGKGNLVHKVQTVCHILNGAGSHTRMEIYVVPSGTLDGL